MTENTQEKKDFTGVLALLHEIREILVKKKQINEKTSTLLLKVHQHYIKYHDSDVFRKVFFEKVGGISAYAALGLKSYYEENGVCFLYNANKDSLKVFGDISEIKETFLEYKERVAKERQKALENESRQEKIEKTLTGLFKKYKIDDLKVLNKALSESLRNK